jgi:hypothetical protein
MVCALDSTDFIKRMHLSFYFNFKNKESKIVEEILIGQTKAIKKW